MGGIYIKEITMLNTKQDREKMLLKFADERSLIPSSVKPLFDEWIRDVHITLAEDGYYYCTGTTRAQGTENAKRYNEGIKLWRSSDLKNWEALGMVWSFEKDATWQNKWYSLNGNYVECSSDVGVRAIYAPEIYQIKGDFYITASLSWPRQRDGEESSHTFLLKSESGKAEGPYKDVGVGPMTWRIDSTLFVDDDGTVYYIWQDGRIAKMKDDMSGFAEDPQRVIQQHFSPEPYCEGVFMFKGKGKYHMALAIWTMDEGNDIGYTIGSIPQKVSYDCVIASADNIYGPYSERYTAITGGGHNSFFNSKDGIFMLPCLEILLMIVMHHFMRKQPLLKWTG
jgi:beta-xylosidase